MKLICLGINGPFPAAGGATSGYLAVQGKTCLQLDMGSGTLSALARYTAPEQLGAVLLSHWHYDHASDLLPLIYRMEGQRGVSPLNVYAPLDEASLIRQALMKSPAFRVHSVQPGECFDVGGVQVQVGLARHPVPAVMYRLTADNRSLCYTGDTNRVEGLAEFAKGCHLLLADGMFPAADWQKEKPHLSAELAAKIACEAQAEKLVITHLNPTIDSSELLTEARRHRSDAQLAERFAVYSV